MSEEPAERIETPADLDRVLERLSPSDYMTAMFGDRPYDGQPHTDSGIRGATEIRGVTFRDVRDAFVRACFHASGLTTEGWPVSLYQLPWQHMDPLAVCQNMLCEIERVMGIYPNLTPSGRGD